MSRGFMIKQVLLMVSMLFSVLASSNNGKNSPRDILVNAFLSNQNAKIIQFNITLTKPANELYKVEISSVRDEDDEYCRDLHDCSSNYINSSNQTTIIPYNGDHVTVGRGQTCDFQNDCKYNISIPQLRQSVIYHVADCIGSVCACRHEKKLPVPKFNPKINENGQLHIDWEINSTYAKLLPEGIYLDHLIIRFDELKDCSAYWAGETHPPISQQLHDYRKIILKGDYTKSFNNSLKGECLLIRMNVVDSRQCCGEVVNSTIALNQKMLHPDDRNNMTVQFILISIFAILIMFFIMILILYGYVWWKKKKNILRYWHNFYNNPQHGSDGSQVIPMRENPLYLMRDSQHEDIIDIPPSAIKEIGKEIGKGAFGRVYVARLGDIPGRLSTRIVAIKKLKKQASPEQLEEFLSEIATMRRAGHHKNIVQLLGSCTVNQCLVMIMEYVPCGDLLKYLRKVRATLEANLKLESRGATSNNNNNNNFSNNNSLRKSTSSQILGPLGKYLDILHSHSTSSASETSSYITQPDTFPSSFQVGTAPYSSRPSCVETTYTNLTIPSNPELTPMIPQLEFVVDHNELHNFALQIARGMKHLEEKHITHRDLAARNILIDENKVLKISDFGLARDGIYVNSRNKKVPLRWLSIEAMKDNLYSSKSDVWSFAIVLWEIGTLGGLPYPTMQNIEILRYLQEGHRLEKPEICSESLYELMLDCWQANRDDRPNFRDICEKLDPKKTRIYIDFSELSPTYVFPLRNDGQI